MATRLFALLAVLILASTCFSQQQVNPSHIPPINIDWDWGLQAWTMNPGSLATIDFTDAVQVSVGSAIAVDLMVESITGTDSSLGITGLAATSGTGGEVVTTGGATTTSGVGGLVSSVGGAGSGSSAGGLVGLTGGAGGATGAGGGIEMTSGASTAATSGTAAASGNISAMVGVPGGATTGTGGAGGVINVAGANGGAATGIAGIGGAGSDVTITAGIGGAATDGSSGVGGVGGSVVITSSAGGVSTGSDDGADGGIFLRTIDTSVFTAFPAPGTGVDAETLTLAELFGGVFVQTPSAGSTTCTPPTGTQISAAVGANLTVGDTFDFTLINEGGTTNYLVTMQTAVGVTYVGHPAVAPIADADAISSQGTFRFRNTAANTWVAYRVN